ncbi:MAG: hypothetical protein E7Z77_02295 [Methanobrevibacter sp.]|uniref:hypothetical protein n=1 Tax=Methanobrevibacter sp. TaxID=66852 RepID=UPI0025E8770C|nr:hypothetical protein [Methanobrevibacter sp.]MBE6508224.1 hypothetical protein [Methanobrevibacter sp.]
MNLTDYPSFFDELPSQPVSCYNCNNDCPGILLDMIKHKEAQQVTPETIFNMQFLIGEKLADRGYGAVNLAYEQIDGEYQHVLQLEYTVVNRFVENMTRLGYTCRILPAHKPRYKFVTFEGYTPMDLLNVYHHLEVIV